MKLHNRITTKTGSTLNLPVNQELHRIPSTVKSIKFVGPLPTDLSFEQNLFEYTLEVPFGTSQEHIHLFVPTFDGYGKSITSMNVTAAGVEVTFTANPQCRFDNDLCITELPNAAQLLGTPPLSNADLEYLVDHHVCVDGPSTWLCLALVPAGQTLETDLLAAGLSADAAEALAECISEERPEDLRQTVVNPTDGSQWELFIVSDED